MKLFGKKKPAETAADAPIDDGAAESAGFTNGSLLGSKAVTLVVLFAIACGPIAIGMLVARGQGSSPVAAAAESSELTPLQQAAGSFAIGFVGSWLSATKEDSTALETYVTTAPPGLGDIPFEYRNLAVVETAPVEDATTVTVMVGADVMEQAGEEEPTWVRRYYEVIVDTASDRLSAIGYPAPVVGPQSTAGAAGLGLNTQLSSDSSAVETIQLMLAAYLIGQGSTSSYLTPGVTIPAISPAPFALLTPVSFFAEEQPSESPADGDTTLVQALVTLQTAEGRTVTATYFVDLTARAGRWEVTSLSTSQSSSTAQVDESPAPTPSSTDDTTEGEDQ